MPPFGIFTQFLQQWFKKKSSPSISLPTLLPFGLKQKKLLAIQKQLLDANFAMQCIIKNINNFKAVTAAEGQHSAETDFNRAVWKFLQRKKDQSTLLLFAYESHWHPDLTYEQLYPLLKSMLMTEKLNRFITLHINQAGTLQWPSFLLNGLIDYGNYIYGMVSYGNNTVAIYTQETYDCELPNTEIEIRVKFSINFQHTKEEHKIFKNNELVYLTMQYMLHDDGNQHHEPILCAGDAWLDFPTQPNSNQRLRFNLCNSTLRQTEDLLNYQHILRNPYYLVLVGYFVDKLAKITKNPTENIFTNNFEADRGQ